MKTSLRLLATAVSLLIGANVYAQPQSDIPHNLPGKLAVSAQTAGSLPHAVATTVSESNKWLNEAQTLSGQALFDYLHNLTSSYKVAKYQDAKAFMYSTVDNIVYNGQRGIVTAYSQIFIAGTSSSGSDYREHGDMNKDGVVDSVGINTEHVWPQSYFTSQYPMLSDLHHMQPTFATPNFQRANYPFGMVKEYIYSTSCGSKMGNMAFEPCNPNKGNTARALLYFVMRYYDRQIRHNLNYKDFWISRVPMFLEWNRMDPPDINEKRRNDLIQKFQGNRNPFIDDYTLPDRIGAEVFASH